MITLKDTTYKIIKDYGETVKSINLEDHVTDYYDRFDYIVGDWAYGRLRLKGFYNHQHKYVKKHNDINNIEDYLKNNCAYGCKHFILEKIKNNDVEKAS